MKNTTVKIALWMNAMTRRLLMTAAVMVLFLGGTAAMLQAGSTAQSWDFLSSANPTVPDVVSNPYGTPTAMISLGWGATGYWDSYPPIAGGRLGIWDIGRGFDSVNPSYLGRISLSIPSGGSDAPGSYVDIVVQVTYYMDIADVPEVEVPGAAFVSRQSQLLWSDPDGIWGQWWVQESHWRQTPSPAAALVWITADYSGSLIDQVVVTTVSAVPPAPPQVSAGLSRSWVYQNTPATTGNRHQVTLSLAVSGSAGYSVTVTKDEASEGDVGIEATADQLVWTIRGSARQVGGTSGTGLVKLNVVATDTATGLSGLAQVTVTSRRLGDIDGQGGVNGQDKLQLNKRLNGLVPNGPEYDLDGVGGSNGQDKLIINKILNGIAIP